MRSLPATEVIPVVRDDTVCEYLRVSQVVERRTVPASGDRLSGDQTELVFAEGDLQFDGIDSFLGRNTDPGEFIEYNIVDPTITNTREKVRETVDVPLRVVAVMELPVPIPGSVVSQWWRDNRVYVAERIPDAAIRDATNVDLSVDPAQAGGEDGG